MGAQTVKNQPAMRDTWVQSLGWKEPWRRAWQPTPVFLPGESPMDRGTWWPTVHRVEKSWTWLSNYEQHSTGHDIVIKY